MRNREPNSHTPQPPLVPAGLLTGVTDDALADEATIRAASPDFAYEQGGPITRQFLDAAYRAGAVHHNSLVMAKLSHFVYGMYSSPPQWHCDFNQGPGARDAADFVRLTASHTGLIACAFDTAAHPEDEGTLFLTGGAVDLDLALRDPARDYGAPDSETGRLFWYHWPVVDAIESGCVRIAPAQPNTVNGYAAANLHNVPVMRSGSGLRLILRINTATDQGFRPTYKNICNRGVPEADYVFEMTGRDRWQLHRMAALMA